ncbi:DUF4123 domain-containing protein [Xenorhabdus bovienii]|uniref:DUF4123 domain-containing protein n=1 Tax=Xenorhabdus bovienii TaxID=40576 RepID=UPI0023B2F85B|nr:DUF4123 domain-containing protein [Xenorhabdus bovienii]
MSVLPDGSSLNRLSDGDEGRMMTATFKEKYRETSPEIKLYALVDGLQYERHFDEELTYIAGLNNPLFRQFPDAEIAFAGPWLFDMRQAQAWEDKFLRLESAAPAVSWLYTTQSLDKLTRHLESYLNIQLKTGETALLRFYDPRVLNQIPHLFTPEQLTHFTQDIEEWQYQLNNNAYIVKGIAS